MKKLLLIVLLIVGCATRVITFNTDEIKEDCKLECITYTISSDRWCDCMHQCSSKKLKKLPLMNRIFVEECWIDSTSSN